VLPATTERVTDDPSPPSTTYLFGSRLTILLSAVAVLAWLLASRVNLYPHVRFSDVPVYEQMARRMANGAIPFRDFDVEYPPLAVFLIWLADRLPGSFADGFSFLMLLASLLSTLGAAAAAGALNLVERRWSLDSLLLSYHFCLATSCRLGSTSL
jgi:hypothetical protein